MVSDDPDCVEYECDRCGETLQIELSYLSMDWEHRLQIHCLKCAVEICQEALPEIQ